MELTKRDNLMIKGIAILGMVMLHLFCRLGSLPYVPVVWIKDTPLIYYLGLFGDICVPLFCFCSGYAHYLLIETHGNQYKKRIPGKLIRFLVNYWLVVILFSVLGLALGKQDVIPGSLHTFLGNILLVGMSYNGAWWFVLTYLFLLLLSPVLAWITRKTPAFILFALSSLVYFAAYIFRFNIILEPASPALNWIWQQSILLGTSQYTYLTGMLLRRHKCISSLRTTCASVPMLPRAILAVLLLTAAFLGHCIIQSLFVAPFTAAAVLLCLLILPPPPAVGNLLVNLGKHSTNIWLTHMFFYLTFFDGLVFCGRFPVVILTFMLVLSISASYVIRFFYVPLSGFLDRHLTA